MSVFVNVSKSTFTALYEFKEIGRGCKSLDILYGLWHRLHHEHKDIMQEDL